jgi:hypothetical protein
MIVFVGQTNALHVVLKTNNKQRDQNKQTQPNEPLSKKPEPVSARALQGSLNTWSICALAANPYNLCLGLVFGEANPGHFGVGVGQANTTRDGLALDKQNN